jgi:hypothetical protein
MIKKQKTNIILPLLFLVLLSNCVSSTASIFGPALTGIKSGSIYQTGLSYASNNVIKQKLGSTPTELVTNFLNKNLNTSTSTSEVINTSNIKKENKDIKLTQNYKNIEVEHSDFVKAVKKMLK